MVLRKRNVQAPAQTLEFSASPFVDTELWREGINLMHHWMVGYFEVNQAFPDFVFAETLKVHRAIADEWLIGLKQAGCISSYEFVRGTNTSIFAPGFIVHPIDGPVHNIELNMGDLQEYDPWVDRTLDKEVPDAVFPDYFVDKYFDVFINEYFLALGYLRKRPNGKTFQPLSVDDHPRHATTKKVSIDPPPEEWRRLIDDLACT